MRMKTKCEKKTKLFFNPHNNAQTHHDIRRRWCMENVLNKQTQIYLFMNFSYIFSRFSVS